MEDLHSRLGYLRGLAEGLGFNDDTKEGKVIRQIIAILDDIVDSLDNLKEDYEELFSYVEAIDEDLTELENDIISEDEEIDEYDDDLDDEYDVSFTVECPECRQEVPIDEDILENEESLEVLCPSCGRVVFINDEDWEDEIECLDEEGGREEEQEGDKE